jgi:hypothetical protein
MPMDAPGPKELPTDVPGATKSPTDVSGAKKSPTASAAPRAGMTGDEVRAIWGEPTEIIQEEPGEGSRFEVGSYGDSRSVRFDRKRRVSSVQK